MDCTFPGGCRLPKAANHESTNDDDKYLPSLTGNLMAQSVKVSKNTVHDPKIGMARAESLSPCCVHRSPISLPTVKLPGILWD